VDLENFALRHLGSIFRIWQICWSSADYTEMHHEKVLCFNSHQLVGVGENVEYLNN